MMNIPFRAAGVAGLLALGLLGACSDLSRSRNLADPRVPAQVLAQQVCVNCHGIDGRSISPNFPNLAAQPAEYLAVQLKAFRSHDRADPEGYEYMWGLSRSLTDAQLQGLADYFAGQPAPPAELTGSTASRERGAKLFREGAPGSGQPACAACHGERAQGQGSFPRLAGQHGDYLYRQLHVISETDQRPASAVMKPAAHALSPKDMRDVADYLQGLGG